MASIGLGGFEMLEVNAKPEEDLQQPVVHPESILSVKWVRSDGRYCRS
jgi:hypothetical protein